MSEPIVYVDTSAIRAGKLAEARTAMAELVELVEAKEPQLLSYGFFLGQNDTRMTVVAVHSDSASLEFHLRVGGPAFRKFGDLIELQRIDVYGPVSDEALLQLQQKAQTLGHGTVTAHRKQAGFARFGACVV